MGTTASKFKRRLLPTFNVNEDVDISRHQKPPSLESYYQLLVGQHELERVVAIHDYHDSDNKNSHFQFDIGDEISVREHSPWNSDVKFWVGIKLRTNDCGIFPPSHVEAASKSNPSSLLPAEAQVPKVITEESLITQLTEKFRQDYPPDLDPKTAFKTVKYIKKLKWEEFWVCFRLAYPDLARSATLLDGAWETLRNTLFTPNRYYIRVTIEAFTPQHENWKVSETYFAPNWAKQWTTWRTKGDQVRKEVSELEEAWAIFRPQLILIEEDIPRLDGFVARFDELVAILHAEIFATEQKVQDALANDAKAVREQENKLRLQDEEFKANPSAFRQGSFDAGTFKPKTGDQDQMQSNWRLSRYFRRQWKSVKRNMGQTEFVMVTVLALATGSMITMGLAIWKCAAPETVPIIDSNFWSTLSAAAVGIASLYCTIIPLLCSQELPVWNESLFRGLLWASLVTSVAAVLVYPYETRASLVLISCSSYGQLATTLLIILGAVTKVIEQEGEIANLKRAARRRS